MNVILYSVSNHAILEDTDRLTVTDRHRQREHSKYVTLTVTDFNQA